MRSEDQPVSAAEAREILGVGEGAGEEMLRRAFRAAVKLAHPDRPGGDDVRLRRVIEAYRRLRPGAAIAPVRRPRTPRLTISATAALLGGWRQARLDDGRQVRLHLPAGLREGERVSVDGTKLAVTVAGDAALAVLGDHLCLTAEVASSFLRQGGRLVVETPLGLHAVWVSGSDAARGLVRVPGRGLPARGHYAQGHLFVRLAAAKERVPILESEAKAKLRRFSAVWAA